MLFRSSVFNIQGPATASTATAATTLGTNDSVASWICVAAWKMLTTLVEYLQRTLQSIPSVVG